MTTAARIQQQPICSTIPARLDRLRWSPFHTRLVLGLGNAWVLDGLSITIASSVTSKLTQPDTLHLTTTEAASTGTVYLIGEVIGALVFGKLSDNIGLALLAGSALQRFGTFEAGVASAKDPKYVVVTQREGLEAADGERHQAT
jgi:MFS family permease